MDRVGIEREAEGVETRDTKLDPLVTSNPRPRLVFSKFLSMHECSRYVRDTSRTNSAREGPSRGTLKSCIASVHRVSSTVCSKTNAAHPVVPSIDRATCWEFPSRRALADACDDAAPGRFYPRYGHGAGLVCEAWIARFEGAEASLLFASGMAAISGVLLARLNSGQRLGLSRKTYGGTVAVAEHELPRFGVEVLGFDPFDEASTETMLAREPAHVHVECPVNPTGRVLDLAAIAERVHAAGATLSCDATFMPPPFQRTCELGVDYAIHSCTKFLGGHSDLLAGVVSGSVEAIERPRALASSHWSLAPARRSVVVAAIVRDARAARARGMRERGDDCALSRRAPRRRARTRAVPRSSPGSLARERTHFGALWCRLLVRDRGRRSCCDEGLRLVAPLPSQRFARRRRVPRIVAGRYESPRASR